MPNVRVCLFYLLSSWFVDFFIAWIGFQLLFCKCMFKEGRGLFMSSM